MSKVTAVLAIALLLFFTAASVHEPALEMSRESVKEVEVLGVSSCDGVGDIEVCLKKRTLTSDIDYIYSVDP